MKYFPRVLHYLKPYRKLAALSAVIIVLAGLVGLLAPWPLKFVVDHILGDEPMPAWMQSALGPLMSKPVVLIILGVLAGFVITLLSSALTVLDSFVNTTIEQNMSLDFRSDLFRHAQQLSLGYHEQRKSGALIFAINFQGDSVARMVMVVPPLAQSALTLVGMFWIVFNMDRWMSVLSLVVVPFLFLATRYYAKSVQPRLMKVREMEGEGLSIVHEAVSMLKVIVAFGREDHEHRRFVDQGRRAVRERVKVTIRQTFFTLAVNITTAAGTALVLGYGAWRVMRGEMTVGDLLVVMAYIAAVYSPLEAISTTVGSLQDTFAMLKTAFALLDVEPDIKDEPGAVDVPGRAHGRVTFEHVNFSYTGRTDTLTDISFDARAGDVVAIVGPTGAGKSTLVSLIPRFYQPNSGRVLLDGRDVRGLTLKSLRQQVSVVLQEPLLFSGTIADNIRYGRPGATDEEVFEAARAANAHDFVQRLPKKYETVIGERGSQLSGGERQRIAVARAFLKDAPVLILDEPTSSIDSKTEAVILDALDRLMVGRTTFMIAHRLSTVRKADMILVMDHGRIVQRGTHEELLEQGGLYKQLHEMQAGRRGGEAEAAVEAERESDELESTELGVRA